MTLQIRRGLAAELAGITPADGEPIWTIDTKKFYVGDGSTVGANLVSAGQDVNTTSNVTFANVNVTFTATVAAIRFGDGSVQTTADTSNPDQSLNTTSNVIFNSVVVGSGSTQGNVSAWGNQNLLLGPSTGSRIEVNSNEYIDIRRGDSYSGDNVIARFGTETTDLYYPGDTIGTDNPKLTIANFGVRLANVYGQTGSELNLIGDQNSVKLRHFNGSDTVDLAILNRIKIELKYPTAIEDIVHSGNSLTAINNTNTQDIFTFDSSVYNSAKFCVQIVDSGEIHFAELNVITDGTNVWKTEYGTNTSNGALGTFSVAMDAGTCKLQFTPTAATSMNIRVSATLLAP